MSFVFYDFTNVWWMCFINAEYIRNDSFWERINLYYSWIWKSKLIPQIHLCYWFTVTLAWNQDFRIWYSWFCDFFNCFVTFFRKVMSLWLWTYNLSDSILFESFRCLKAFFLVFSPIGEMVFPCRGRHLPL